MFHNDERGVLREYVGSQVASLRRHLFIYLSFICTDPLDAYH